MAAELPAYPASDVCDCVHCSEGERCEAGSAHPASCPAGFFCPGALALALQAASNSTGEPCGVYSVSVPCPPGTFQPLLGQTSSAACKPCGDNLATGDHTFRGFHCPSYNTSEQERCPAGHFCLPGYGPAVPCPGGTYRDIPGAYDSDACNLCWGGVYCPNGTIVPLFCPAGFFCPPGTPSPKICPGGHYCQSNASEPVICPAGTYCSFGSTVPAVCEAGTYCPEGSTIPTICPLGMYSHPNVTINRTSIDAACAPCPRGTFGGDPARLYCDTCWAGYVCMGNTTRGNPTNVTSHRGMICPKGHYCKNGTIAAVPCERGSFNPGTGATSADACQPCPRNSFNNHSGSYECKPCGGSAVSSLDSTSCECKGKNRVFHEFDAACRCMQGHTIYSAAGAAQLDQAQEDGVLDCEALVLERCADLRAKDGTCLEVCADTACAAPPCYCDLEGLDFCRDACPAYQTAKAAKVQVDETIGTAVICECACPADSEDPNCADPNTTPIEKSYGFSSDSAGTPVLTITEASGAASTYLVPSMASAPNGDSSAQFIGSSPDGFAGVLDASLEFYEALGLVPCSMDEKGICREDSGARRRLDDRLVELSRRAMAGNDEFVRSATFEGHQSRGKVRAGPAALHKWHPVGHRSLLNHSHGEAASEWQKREAQLRAGQVETTAVTSVPSPLVCIKAGSGVMFSVTSAAGVDHFPEYVANSMFNTNPEFDYGAFAALRGQVAKGYPVASLYHVFEEPGIYVFRDAGAPARETVVGVVSPVVDCPRAFLTNPIQPLSAALLRSFPDSEEGGQVMLSPDYQLIFGVSGALAGVLALTLLLLYVRKNTGWGKAAFRQAGYRKQGAGEDYHALASRRQRVRAGDQSGDGLLGLDELDDLAAGYVDLEGFNVQMLFDKLQDQTHLVAEQLTQQKQDVREFYDKVTRETVTLRTLVDKNNQAGFSTEAVRRAEKRAREASRELRRRKALGAEALVLLNTQHAALAPAADQRREHRDMMIGNAAALKEAIAAARGGKVTLGAIPELRSRLAQMKAGTKKRQAVRVAMNVGSGAELLDGARKPVKRAAMLGADGQLAEIPGLLRRDESTALIVPCAGTEMRVPGHVHAVPENCCVHPVTGQVIPIEGNVVIDAASGKFHVGSALNASEMTIAAGDSLPFVCNQLTPTSDSHPSSSAPYAHLIGPDDAGLPLNEARDMIDPFSGLRVPVLAVTNDLRTGALVAVGGTMTDPETRLLTPIRLGALMEDPATTRRGRPALVLGVRICPETARVLPLGGSCGEEGDTALTLGTAIRDGFSGEKRRVARCIVDPLNGSKMLAVDDDMLWAMEGFELAAEAEMEEHLERQLVLIERLVGPGPSGPGPATGSKKEVMASLEQLASAFWPVDDAWSRLRDGVDSRVLGMREQSEVMAAYTRELARSGRQQGRVMDPVTEQELPLLVGCPIYDESSKHDVLVLAVQTNEETGYAEGLGCTVIDPVSGSMTSATIGGRMRDPGSGETVPITGVLRETTTYQVVPTSNLRGKPGAGSLPGGIDAAGLLAGLLKQLELTSGVGGGAGLLSAIVGGGAPFGTALAPVAPQDGQGTRIKPLVKPRTNASSVPTIVPSVGPLGTVGGSDAEGAETPEQRLEALLEETRRGEGADEETLDMIGRIRQEVAQDAALLHQSMEEAGREMRQVHERRLQAVQTNSALSAAERERLIDEVEENMALLNDIMESEHERQEAGFRRMKLQAAERRLAKLKKRKARGAAREERFENGEITTAERAEERLDDLEEEEFEDGMDEIQRECLRQRMKDVAAEQSSLLSAISVEDGERPSEEQVQMMMLEYDQMVEQIETRGRNELYRRQADLERQLEARKTRKQALLRKQAERQEAAQRKSVSKGLAKMLGVVKGFSMKGPRGASHEDALATREDRHSRLQTRLVKALDEQAEAERAAFALAVQSDGARARAELEERRLAALAAEPDAPARAALMAGHEAEKQSLEAQLLRDRDRRERELEAQLAARKEMRRQEHNALLAREATLLQDPTTFADADRVALDAERVVRQEAEAARLAHALRAQDEADVHAVQAQREAANNETRADAQVALNKALDGANDEERKALLREHEEKLARMAGEATVAKGRADEDLQVRLRERRAKKQAFLSAQHAAETQSAAGAANRSAAELVVENTRKILATALRQEDELAKAAESAVEELQAEVRALRDEIKRKAAVQLEAERESRAEIEASAPDAEREALLASHDRNAAALAAQLATDEARQVAALEQRLLARKAKKVKKLEAAHTKELGEALTRTADHEAGVDREETQRVRLEDEAKRQEAEELEALRARMEQQKQKMLADEQRKLQNAIATLSEDVGVKEREQLIGQAERNMSKLEEYMDKEKLRQEEEIKLGVEAKKRKKAERLKAQAERQKREEELQREQHAELERMQAALEAEAQEQMARMQAELEAEKQREAARLAEELEVKRDIEAAEERRKAEEAASRVTDESEKEKLLAEAEENIRKMQDVAGVEKAKREAELEAMLAKKRAKKKAALQKRHQDALEQKMLEQVEQVEVETGAAAAEGEEDAEEEASAAQSAAAQKKAHDEFAKQLEEERGKFEAEMQEAVAQQERLKEELKLKQEEERRKLEEEMSRDAQAFEEAMKQEQAKRLADLAEKKKAMEEEMSKQSANLSAEERAKMISQHEDNMRKLEQETEGKKEAMDRDLQAKLAQRKKKRQAQQKKEQAAEQEKLDDGLKERDGAAKRQLKAKELEAIFKMAVEGNGEKAAVLLRQRHHSDEDELRADQSSHYARSMSELPEGADATAREKDLQAANDAAMADLRERHAEELRRLQAAEVPPSPSLWPRLSPCVGDVELNARATAGGLVARGTER